MFLSIENPIITDDSSFLDRLSLGGQTMLLGLLVVFAMLFVIYLCMMIMQAVFTRRSKKAAKKTVPVMSTEVPAPAVQTTDAAFTQTDDTQLVAAITAAIAAYTGDAPSSFRVVSFKKR